IYVLNKKRGELGDIEQRYGVSIEVVIDEALEGARMTVESSGPRPIAPPVQQQSLAAPIDDDDDFEEIDEHDERDEANDHVDDVGDDVVEISLEGADTSEGEESEGDRQGRRRRRRRRGGRGRGRRDAEGPGDGSAEALDGEQDEPLDVADLASAEPEGERPDRDSERPARAPRRRRGRRTEIRADDSAPMAETPSGEEAPVAESAPPVDGPAPVAEAVTTDEPAPKPRRSRRKAAAAPPEAAEPEAVQPEPAMAEVAPGDEAPAKPVRKRRTSKAAAASEEEAPAPAEATPAPANDDATANDSDEPRRGGWWQRTFG
ncbi:MAG: ribonuclease E/G, partial [Sphingomicrobium sp.]